MFVGIDLGSRNVKIAILEKEKNWQFKKFDTVSFYRDYGKMENEQLVISLTKLGLETEKIEALVGTGYGRQTVAIKGAQSIPEIKAHVAGVTYLTQLKDFTLLDLGGQDSKVVKVRSGRMVDFETNDRCAASTGRYLENMASVLNVDLNQLSQHYQHPVELTSTCAIFGETELIGKIVEGHPTENLAAGVNYTIFKRIKPMLMKLNSPTLVFTGGVAQNTALQQIIAAEMGVKVVIPDNPQYAGAIGCIVTGMNINK